MGSDKIGEKEQKELKIEKERKRLEKLFIALPANKFELAKELIKNASFMSVTLQDLSDVINEKGIKEKYKNGENQYGYKDSTENKTYDKMIKNYLATIKQLNDMLPKDSSPKNPDDEFDSFGVDDE